MMKIYFACSIIGGRETSSIYQIIVDTLKVDGHRVLTERLASDDIIQQESSADPIDIYQRDVAWILESDLLIAEITTPSHGVGYEIGFALNHDIPVICLYQADVPVSKMIIGNQDPKLTVYPYGKISHALKFIRQKLDEL
jgi:hypothetical protein